MSKNKKVTISVKDILKKLKKDNSKSLSEVVGELLNEELTCINK